MGAWAELHISPGRVKGLAEERVSNPATGAFDEAEITAERKQAAKDLVWRKLRDRKVGGMAPYIDRYASPAAMLDALANKAELADDLQDALALAFLVVYLPGVRNSTRDLVGEELKAIEKELDGAVRALADTAPFVMGWRSKSGSRPRGGALASTMNTYGD